MSSFLLSVIHVCAHMLHFPFGDPQMISSFNAIRCFIIYIANTSRIGVQVLFGHQKQ